MTNTGTAAAPEQTATSSLEVRDGRTGRTYEMPILPPGTEGSVKTGANLMSKARDMQSQAQRMQEELARKQVTADAGGGMVQATVNGKMELVKVRIDKSKVDVNDTEMLEDVIVAAVHGAQARAQEMMKQEMQKIAGDLGLPPGMLGG